MDKVVSSAADAVSDIPDGATLAVGGFGLCGIPSVLIQALHDKGVIDLGSPPTTAASTTGGWESCWRTKDPSDDLVYVGENKEFARRTSQVTRGRADPQGTLAERLRAGGAGIPAFFTITGGYADRRRRTAVAVCRGRLGAVASPKRSRRRGRRGRA